MIWLHATIISLAAWRLMLLLSDDSGPWDIFQRFRSYLSRKARTEPSLRKSKVHEGIRCARCSSIWLAAPIAAYVFLHSFLPDWLTTLGDWFLLWNAISAIVILINRIPEKP